MWHLLPDSNATRRTRLHLTCLSAKSIVITHTPTRIVHLTSNTPSSHHRHIALHRLTAFGITYTYTSSLVCKQILHNHSICDTALDTSTLPQYNHNSLKLKCAEPVGYFASDGPLTWFIRAGCIGISQLSSIAKIADYPARGTADAGTRKRNLKQP